jgi:hypothetical protein
MLSPALKNVTDADDEAVEDGAREAADARVAAGDSSGHGALARARSPLASEALARRARRATSG